MKSVLLCGALCAHVLGTFAQTWQPVAVPFSTFPSVNAIATSTDVNDDVLYLATGPRVARSSNNGRTWSVVREETGRTFTSLGFISANQGHAGTSSELFLRTTNGGSAWTAVQGNLPQPIFGIDAMTRIGQFLYAVGSTSDNDSRAYFLISFDGGGTWRHTELSSQGLATGLTDVAFADISTGCVSGLNANGGVILRSADGGNTFTEVYNSGVAGESVVDLTYVTSTLVYAALQTPSSVSGANSRVLRSTDAGATWTELLVAADNLQLTAIGFANESDGWVGSTSSPLYRTTDGGDTWNLEAGAPRQAQTIEPISESYILVGTISPVSGTGLYELRDFSSSIGEVGGLAFGHDLELSSPLLQAGSTAQVSVATRTHLRLDFLDAAGRVVATPLDAELAEGSHSVELRDTDGLAPGAYFLRLSSPDGSKTISVVRP